MKVVRVGNGREAIVPETYSEGLAMLIKTMNAYQDRRGGNLERQSCAARVAFGLFGSRFLADGPTDALVYLLQEICKREGAGLEKEHALPASKLNQE